MSDIRCYVNPKVPGTTETGQRENMTGEIYVEDRRGKIIDSLIRSVRKGTIIEVMELYCLAPAQGYANKRRRILAERIEAIKKRGGVIRETRTGYVSKGRMARMALMAYEQIATSGRARSRSATGRPPKWILTNHDRETIDRIWSSRRYKNDDERTVAVHANTGKKMSRQWLRLHFGSPHKRDVSPIGQKIVFNK